MRCAGGNVGGEMVALLRVVNLGARNKVPMAQLRTLLEDAGYDGVRTYIASGNVILDGPKSRTAVAAVVAGHPFRRRHIWLARRVPRRAARAGRERTARCPRLSPDRAVLVGADVYLTIPRLSAARLERLLAVRGTHRNWRTVAKLAGLA